MHADFVLFHSQDFSLQLFDYLADSLHRFLKQMDLLNTTETIPLGLTFAFACQQMALNKAVLISWSKHFHVDGVEGCEIVGMLNDAIKRKGVSYLTLYHTIRTFNTCGKESF